MSRLTRRKILKTAGAGSLIALAGCTEGDGEGDGNGDGGTPTGGNGGSTPSGNGDTVTVGILAPQAGPFAVAGESVQAAAEAAIEKKNEDGGVGGQDIEYFVRDTGTDPEVGSRAARELIEEEDVSLLTGTASSSVGLAVSAVADELDAMFVSQGGSSDLTGAECRRVTFMANPSVYQNVVALGNFAIGNLGDTVYTITNNYAAGESSLEASNEIVPENGGEAVGNSYVDFGQTDMSSEITQAMGSGADIMWAHVYASDIATLFQQGREYGLFDEMEVLSTAPTLDAYSTIGQEAIAGHYATLMYYWGADNDPAREFAERVRDLIDRPPDIHGSIYPGVHTALTVMDEVGDAHATDDIVSELEGREFTLKVFGPERNGQYFRECDHRAPIPVPIGEAKQPGEPEEEFDMFDIVEYADAEEVVKPCNETGCNL
jgi:branched-chain amino acid transport system substrate-binding protein